MSIDFGNRNSAVGIILGLNLLFFLVWVVSLFLSVGHPILADATGKLYGVFIGVNNALMLILNSEAKNGNGSQSNPTPPVVNPAQTK
jgi:hypothetical protein